MDGDWDSFDKKFEEITDKFQEKIEDVKRNANKAREFKAQKDFGLDFVKVLVDESGEFVKKS